jgi:hypothetical protein
MIKNFWNPSMVAGALLLGASLVVQAEEIGWMSDCSSIKDWYDDKSDKNFNAKVEQFEPSVLKVTQAGADSWGKVAYVVQDVDLEKTSLIQTKVNKVDLNSAFSIAVATLDWSEFYVVVPRSSSDGVHMGDIKAATGWTGKKSFNLVVIVEGKDKASYFDQIKIASKI